MSEMGQNSSSAVGSAISSADQTSTELGKDASNTCESLLNQTGEVARKNNCRCAATVIGNVSGEIKEGVRAK